MGELLREMQQKRSLIRAGGGRVRRVLRDRDAGGHPRGDRRRDPRRARQEGPAPQFGADGTALVRAEIRVDDLNHALGANSPSRTISRRLGGLLNSTAGAIPQTGDRFYIGGLRADGGAARRPARAPGAGGAAQALLTPGADYLKRSMTRRRAAIFSNRARHRARALPGCFRSPRATPRCRRAGRGRAARGRSPCAPELREHGQFLDAQRASELRGGKVGGRPPFPFSQQHQPRLCRKEPCEVVGAREERVRHFAEASRASAVRNVRISRPRGADAQRRQRRRLEAGACAPQRKLGGPVHEPERGKEGAPGDCPVADARAHGKVAGQGGLAERTPYALPPQGRMHGTVQVVGAALRPLPQRREGDALHRAALVTRHPPELKLGAFQRGDEPEPLQNGSTSRIQRPRRVAEPPRRVRRRAANCRTVMMPRRLITGSDARPARRCPSPRTLPAAGLVDAVA